MSTLVSYCAGCISLPCREGFKGLSTLLISLSTDLWFHRFSLLSTLCLPHQLESDYFLLSTDFELGLLFFFWFLTVLTLLVWDFSPFKLQMFPPVYLPSGAPLPVRPTNWYAAFSFSGTPSFTKLYIWTLSLSMV